MSKIKDFITIKQELLKSRRIFEDSLFPPNDNSLYVNGEPPINHAGKIVWKRPKELVLKPEFVVDGAERFDLDQGDLGDCWFIAGAAVLATNHRKQFEKVVPLDQGFDAQNYTGMFRFNIWWYGEWTEVIVDDYLPTQNGELVYCRNNESRNEFWPCLLEKAYAKLHGCYNALDGGFTQDAMVDLTGGISELIDIKDKKRIPTNLYSLLSTSYRMKTLMGATILMPNRASMCEIQLESGLISGHAYSITGFTQVHLRPAVVNLIRLRNPWGHGEWKGAWSDKSPEMKQLSHDVRDSLQFKEKDDGEFWMSFEDFKQSFDKIQLCHLQPDAVIQELEDNTDKETWYVSVYKGSWIIGHTAGGCGKAPYQNLHWRNSQFFVTLEPQDEKSHSTLIVSLMLKNWQLKTSIAIGLKVYKLKENAPAHREKQQKILKKYLTSVGAPSDFTYDRELTRRFSLKPGTYVFIPCTYNHDEEGEFILRMFTEAKATSGSMDHSLFSFDDTDGRHIVEESFLEIVNKYSRHDRSVTAQNLKDFLKDVANNKLQERIKLPLEFCKTLVSIKANGNSRYLHYEAIKEIWKELKSFVDIFRQFDKKNTDSVDAYYLVTMFSKIGLPEDEDLMNWSVLESLVKRYCDEDNAITLNNFIIASWKLKLVSQMLQEKAIGNSQKSANVSRNEVLQIMLVM